MGTRDGKGVGLDRLIGWGVLGGVLLSWAALGVWAAAHPCFWDCSALYWLEPVALPPIPVGVVVWAISFGGLPVGSWLVGNSYARERSIRSAARTRVAATALVCIGFGSLLLSALTVLALTRSSGTRAILAAAGVAWFGVLGIGALVAARSLSGSVHKKLRRDPPLWAAAVAVWLVGAVVPHGLAALLDDPISPDNRFFDDGASAPTRDYEPPRAAESTRPPRKKPKPKKEPTPTPLPEPPPVHSFPVTIGDKDSGYEMGARIETKPSGYKSLGRQYSVLLKGRWAAPGEPNEQLCAYEFFSGDGKVVRRRSVPFGFMTGGRRFVHMNHYTFFESQMRGGDPVRAEIDCKDSAAN